MLSYEQLKKLVWGLLGATRSCRNYLTYTPDTLMRFFAFFRFGRFRKQWIHIHTDQLGAAAAVLPAVVLILLQRVLPTVAVLIEVVAHLADKVVTVALLAAVIAVVAVTVADTVVAGIAVVAEVADALCRLSTHRSSSTQTRLKRPKLNTNQYTLLRVSTLIVE